MANRPDAAAVSKQFCGATPELVSELTAEVKSRLAGVHGWVSHTTYYEGDVGHYTPVFEVMPEDAWREIERVSSCLKRHFKARGLSYQKLRANHATADILYQFNVFNEREMSSDLAYAQGFGFRVPGAE